MLIANIDHTPYTLLEKFAIPTRDSITIEVFAATTASANYKFVDPLSTEEEFGTSTSEELSAVQSTVV
ncbi:hypothetical protein KIN20_010143 [Parelaphostrongylus tenuis]|uniref:Uncharacterized protein n=1 Tax=Parelaphostrongylus tenuis TaxID=148309 RepID=A0AAD5QK37_PARTN|nr:hypothetical protein KIN20_010143 [Parelaphostrongylus tenuis]